VAVAVIRSDPPRIFLAESDEVLGRLLALRLVARTPSIELEGASLLPSIRQALLDERWGDAVELWMAATGEVVDAYPDEEIATEVALDRDHASVEIRLAPVFEDAGPGDQAEP